MTPPTSDHLTPSTDRETTRRITTTTPTETPLPSAPNDPPGDITMEQQSPEFILEAFADPNSVRDIVRGTRPLLPRLQTGTSLPQTP